MTGSAAVDGPTTAPYPFPFPQVDPLVPPARWAELRDRCPIAPVRLPSGADAVLLTRYDDVRAFLAHPGTVFGQTEHTAPIAADGNDFDLVSTEEVDILNGAGHRRWRGLLMRELTARRTEAMRPRLQQLTDDLLDAMEETGPPADLMAGLATPLPMLVMCDLLGFPLADADRLDDWSRSALALDTGPGDGRARAYAAFEEYMGELIARRRDEPGDDLLSALITAHDADDGSLSEAELVRTGLVLVVAGRGAPAGAIGAMVAALLTDRGRFEAVVADPGLVPATVEEALRFDVHGGLGVPRYAPQDVAVPSGTVPAGSTVLVSFAAANRDPRRFADPDVFDPARADANRHLGFSGGVHFCGGQSLARVEMQVVLATLARRFPSLELAQPAGTLRVQQGVIEPSLEECAVRW